MRMWLTPKPRERHARGGARSPWLLNGSASRLPMSRETMGQSGSNTRFNGANFSIAAALRSSPFGDSRLHLWIFEDSCFLSEHEEAQ